jgi:CheY-like chemotaxis protein
MAETRKLAAILAADVAGYSKLAGATRTGRLRGYGLSAHSRWFLAHDTTALVERTPRTATLVSRMGEKPESLSMLKDHQARGSESLDDLKGLNILLVEDSRAVGDALKGLLELLGANVAGPAATIAAAEALLAHLSPDVAIVDLHLRGGEYSNALIAALNERGVPVLVLTGSPEFPPLPLVGATAILEKPVSETALLAHLCPLVARKAARRAALDDPPAHDS